MAVGLRETRAVIRRNEGLAQPAPGDLATLLSLGRTMNPQHEDELVSCGVRRICLHAAHAPSDCAFRGAVCLAVLAGTLRSRMRTKRLWRTLVAVVIGECWFHNFARQVVFNDVPLSVMVGGVSGAELGKGGGGGQRGRDADGA